MQADLEKMEREKRTAAKNTVRGVLEEHWTNASHWLKSSFGFFTGKTGTNAHSSAMHSTMMISNSAPASRRNSVMIRADSEPPVSGAKTSTPPSNFLQVKEPAVLSLGGNH